MRIILYTGKGGVGKTSVAAATACKLARMGKKVLIMSTDQAHSLSDAIDLKLSFEPIEVVKGLYAMEVDPIEECERAWGNIKEYIKKVLTAKNGESIEAEELLVFPGLEELISLFKIQEISESGQFDVIIVDCAPTGETLSLLKYPEMFGDWINKFLPMKRKAVAFAGPVVEKIAKVPMPDTSVFEDIERISEKFNCLKQLLDNKEVVSIRIVTTPEKIVLQEAKRNFSYLHLYGYNVDAIIVNKIYPKESLSGYFSKWIEKQTLALEDIKESFGEIPIFYLELLRSEIRTLERLQQAADLLYDKIVPDEVLYQGKIFSIETYEGRDCFSILLPFFELSDMELIQKGDELTVIIKNERRKFILPNKLKNRDISGAKYREGKLNILF